MTRPGIVPSELDALIFVSVTGISSPSIDAKLINLLGLSPSIKRMPIFGLGCVAGAAGIARAADYVRAFPDQVAALVSVELCSLTWQRDDISAANLISSGLFGDGAASVLVGGADTPFDGPEIVATRSTFYPQTEDVMGWDISEKGFQITLSPDVPKVVREHLRNDVDSFLLEHGLSRAEISSWIIHTGGPAVLDAVQDSLELSDGALDLSWDCLRRVGNLSSASVLVVLEDVLRRGGGEPGSYCVLAAMGPGFCSEVLLLRWSPMPTQFDTDVFVVGGGPAGISTALAARQQGFRAMVADILQPPIDKACGEGLMPDSVSELERLGVVLDDYEHARFAGIRFVGPTTSVAAEFPSGSGFGVRRTTLHRALISQAVHQGIHFLWGTRVHGISGQDVHVDGRNIKAQWIVGADGQQSLVRSWAGLDAGREFERRIALRRHFRLSNVPTHVEIHWADNSQAYLTPVSSDEVCVAIISKHKLNDFDAELKRIPTLRELLANAEPRSTVRGGLSLSNRLRHVYCGNVALIGDASGGVDAITGEGLALAFRQALSLADAMVAGDLAVYEQAHRSIEALPQFMRRAMLLMDKSALLRRRTLAAFQVEPALFARMLSVHVGKLPLTNFGASALARFGWQMVTA